MIPTLRRQSQTDLCDLKASLAYRRHPGHTEKPFSPHHPKKKKEKIKLNSRSKVSLVYTVSPKSL